MYLDFFKKSSRPFLYAITLASFTSFSSPTAWADTTLTNFQHFEITLSGDSWNTESIGAVTRAFNYWDNLFINPMAVGSYKLIASIAWDTASSLGGTGIIAQASPTTTAFRIKDNPMLENVSKGTTVEKYWREGIEKTSSDVDFRIRFNDSKNFFFGENANEISSDQKDFQSVLTHELGHAMGFFTSHSTEYFYTQSAATTFDFLTRDQNGDYVDPYTRKDNGIYTVGSQQDTFIYAPDPEKGGSSWTHIVGKTTAGLPQYIIDNNNPLNENALMQYDMGDGIIRRELQATELTIFEEMGWILATPIPEPSTATLSLIGLTFLFQIRRRKA